jgi:hypothetical protein
MFARPRAVCISLVAPQHARAANQSNLSVGLLLRVSFLFVGLFVARRVFASIARRWACALRARRSA